MKLEGLGVEQEGWGGGDLPSLRLPRAVAPAGEAGAHFPKREQEKVDVNGE